MCYFLYIASPLTLSEVRSMLPPGLTADLAAFPNQQALKSLHPGANTVARVLAGRCSCDLVRPRLVDAREDERHHRERYRRLEISRPGVIAALERHRRGPRFDPAVGSPQALADFVLEHGRNAGPTLYLLVFGADESLLPHLPLLQTTACSLSEVRLLPDRWLVERNPTLVG